MAMKFDLNEQIDCAIRERGAKSHLMELEKEIRQKNRFMIRAVSIAASLLLILTVGIDLKLGSDIKSVGYAFNPVQGQSGGSQITALMQDYNIEEALRYIDEARVLVAKEIASPSSDDPEYMTQLNIDSQELDFLEAVCYMRQGKYFKAKRYLKRIVAGGSHFSAEAEKLLGEL